MHLFRSRSFLSLSFVFAAAAAAACGSSAADHRTRVDSVVPWDTALARFRTGLEATDTLVAAAPSRDELVRRFVARLEARDTTGLLALSLTRNEFAWLYYPGVPEAHPPYELSPGLMWFMLEGNSRRGLAATLAEHGGRSLGVVGYDCLAEPRRVGQNTIWPLCVLHRLEAPGDTLKERLFGPIIERDHRFKLVSLAGER